ncbi:YqaA family protein [Aureimonas sp. AU12]|uniref:YqaA family protein n=1 Tax=Aureimonas sp. AU12 TaxID=1638161 RepID=UPI000A658F78|nr:VTT domain-containing protein [Aureimonas sp. AU12]
MTVELLAAYGGLFAAAFLAATLIPASSEAVLVGLLLAGTGSPWLLTLAATLGNTLGGLFNWGCGRFLAAYREAKWFPVPERRIARASGWFERFGLPSLLFAWVPVVGDALTVIAGLLGVRVVPFLLLVGTGKGLRYLFVTLTTLGLASGGG